jgi:hypothetical protein
MSDDDERPAAAPARPARRRVASSVAALVLALVVGIGIGYELGREGPVAPPQPTTTDGDGPARVQATGVRCLQGSASELWLGAEFVNRGPGTIVLRGARVELPLGGLTVTALEWGTCGQVGALAAHGPEEIWLGGVDAPEHTSVWISAQLDLTDVSACPAPYPVLFHVPYIDRTGRITELVFGFADLGGVPHPACAADG